MNFKTFQEAFTHYSKLKKTLIKTHSSVKARQATEETRLKKERVQIDKIKRKVQKMDKGINLMQQMVKWATEELEADEQRKIKRQKAIDSINPLKLHMLDTNATKRKESKKLKPLKKQNIEEVKSENSTEANNLYNLDRKSRLLNRIGQRSSRRNGNLQKLEIETSYVKDGLFSKSPLPVLDNVL